MKLAAESGAGFGMQAETRRHAILEHLRIKRLLRVAIGATHHGHVLHRRRRDRAMAVMMVAAAQQPCAGDVHASLAGNRDRLGKVDRHRAKIRLIALVTNQERDHRQDDGAGEPREIAQLAGAEREARIVGMFPGVGVGEGREQQGSRMCAHCSAIRDQRD